jgi:hypothetical protein
MVLFVGIHIDTGNSRLPDRDIFACVSSSVRISVNKEWSTAVVL